MKQFPITFENNAFKTLGWTLVGLLILLILMESWRFLSKPANQTIGPQEQLENAGVTFQKKQQRFLRQTQELSETLTAQLRNGANTSRLYQTIKSYPEFWGTKLLRDGDPIVWDGFEIYPEESDRNVASLPDSISTHINKQNNVVYLQYDAQFNIQSDTNNVVPYHLSTAVRIEQSNALPIGDKSEYNLANLNIPQNTASISYNFFNTLPENTDNYITLRSTTGDSVGIAYIRQAEYNNSLQKWENNNWFWRSIYIAFFFVCISIVLSQWAERTSKWSALFFELSLIGIGWLVFYYLDIPSRWIPELKDAGINTTTIDSYKILGNYLKAGFFIFLIAISLFRKLNIDVNPVKKHQFLSTIFIGFFIGVGNLLAILTIIYSSFRLIENTSLQVLDLNIIPSFGTILVFIALGLAFYGLGLALVSINQFIIHSRKDHGKLISTLIAIGFIMALLVAQIFVPEILRLNWAVFLCLGSFAIIYFISYYRLQASLLSNQLSTLRILVLSSALLALVITPIIYYSYLERQDQNLKKVSADFVQNTDDFARDLTRKMLEELEQTLKGISPQDLDSRVPYIQGEFTSTVEDLLPANKRTYSLDLQLIKPRGELVANYSTDLNSPDWVNIFDLQRLSAAVSIEQITGRTNRPIVQQPELRNQGKYETFYRGWIPIFEGTSSDIVAWILCSVYKERPNFNKPIRAVLASLTYDDWNQSYAMAEYQNNQLHRYAQQGIPSYYPQYNDLLKTEQQALLNNSLVYYTSKKRQNTYRNLLTKEEPDRVIKISTVSPNFRNILFTFFKLNFVFLASGAACLVVLHLLRIKKFIFLNQHQRFKNRILDNFLLATLLFLLMLVFVTHYAIEQQNKEIVEQELFKKLESLTESTESNKLFQSGQRLSSSFTLDSLTAPLNADASFYNKRIVSESTTPQIFQQHLLSSSLSFPIYNRLYNIQERDALQNVQLASQNLLIGYRSVLSANNEPIAAIAIPTFVQSPKYDQQLLETISYLVVLYLFVFGIFILGTALIARQLTKPLHRIQHGLDKISTGDLDTTIPVTSNDEIGNLAEAYNTMVYQLKELQKELAQAEREAAWKEMAQQVAHEIKNPLTPMKLNIQHLKRQLKTNQVSIEELKPKIEQITQNLIDQIQSLSNIASDFSKFSQPLDKDFTKVEVNSILHSVKDLYQNDENIIIHTELAENEIEVNGIPDELRRVFINIIKNAFEAMPEGGKITIRSYTKKDSAFIEIEDNGAGISEEDKSKIFVPNFSTKSSGTGLGLAICKKVIEAHEGNISFASIKNKGTTFVIKLSLAE
ncbi:MAG: ATP-binding protein [Balneolaceae bacterium]|nr:ATP-binding protein [Balneolaceae bacterium]